ncbi:hypothetical protein A3Q56_01732 [Intoshia linei]|uniref:MICOS complex subunit MIC10 n=1 Tax=Intoshia linei TaxID=1819745 RepID=A0A177B881_9BILA|nr:hypothetical protein A3Q56_01732 [Intoshia linei]
MTKDIDIKNNITNSEILKENLKVPDFKKIGNDIELSASELAVKSLIGSGAGTIYSLLTKRKAWPITLGFGVGIGMGLANVNRAFPIQRKLNCQKYVKNDIDNNE